jgi:hypothetical protein
MNQENVVQPPMDTEGANAVKLQPSIVDGGGKRSAPPLWGTGRRAESGVAAPLCHRTPNAGATDTRRLKSVSIGVHPWFTASLSDSNCGIREKVI